MKKLISILICAAIIFSMLPAVSFAGAEAAEQEFVPSDVFAFNSYKNAGTVTVDEESGCISVKDLQTRYYHMSIDGLTTKMCGFVVFRLNVLNSGTYNVQLRTNNQTTISAAPEIYLVADDGTITRGTSSLSKGGLVGENSAIGYFDFSDAVKDSYSSVTDLNGVDARVTISAPGNYFLVLSPTAQSRALSSGTSDGDLVEKEIVDPASGALLGANVNSGTHLQEYYLSGIKLVPVVAESEPEPAPTEISYGVFVSDAACASAVTANGTKLSDTTDGFATGELATGTTLTATAEDNVPGYKFRYWVLGSAATGRYYSSDNIVTVNPYANIALTAIYTEVEEETEYLDFFNWNGDYVDSKAIADEKVTALPTATLTGYAFAHWLLEDNETELTSENYAAIAIPDGVSKAMAQYTALNGYDSSNKPKGTSSTGWTRDGKLVTYSETYEFFTWLNEVGEIKAYDKMVEDQIPLVVLEEKNGVYMIEYDKGGYTIVEAGILFGSDADVDVKSAYSKATVKRILPHGQFTAAPIANATASLQSNARGYVMYRDKEDNIKVVYSK